MIKGAVSFLICMALTFIAGANAFAQPQSVPKLTERSLDKASYVRLAKEWKRYITEHGESVDALVNLGRAYRYSSQPDAAMRVARRAMALDPDDPRALTFAATMLSIYEGDEDLALQLLKHCMEVAPDYLDGLTMLTAVYLRRGELDEAEQILKTIFKQRVIPQPLQDYAYNMLVGLPEGAVLVTNGDNDTFPPLALQAGMGLRKDVIVINRSLLNLKGYAEAVFKRHPSIAPKGGMEPEKNQILSTTLLRRMAKHRKAPLYFAATVNLDNLGFLEDISIEGVNWHVSEKGMSGEESARLFLEEYRLDSATDWNFPWDLLPSVAGIMRNYISSMIKIAEKSDLTPKTKKKLMEKAMDIASFHKMSNLMCVIRSYQEK